MCVCRVSMDAMYGVCTYAILKNVFACIHSYILYSQHSMRFPRVDVMYVCTYIRMYIHTYRYLR